MIEVGSQNEVTPNVAIGRAVVERIVRENCLGKIFAHGIIARRNDFSDANVGLAAELVEIDGQFAVRYCDLFPVNIARVTYGDGVPWIVRVRYVIGPGEDAS